jgi:hypothetical protein
VLWSLDDPALHLSVESASEPLHETRGNFTEMDLTADYADYTDTIGYDYQCPEVLPRKDFVRSSSITPSKSVKSAESAVSIPEFRLKSVRINSPSGLLVVHGVLVAMIA